MTATIKIFGERNTSTNALRALIMQNSESVVAPSVASELDKGIKGRLAVARRLCVPGYFQERMVDRVFEGRSPIESWKHAATNFDDVQVFQKCHVIFCVRHPASWLLGLYRRPYHIYGSRPRIFREFLGKRWKTVRRERLDRANVSAMELYNLKMYEFMKMQFRLSELGISSSVVRHEDFATDQSEVFNILKPHLLRPSSTFNAIEISTKDNGKDRKYYEEYYGNQIWREEIDSTALQLSRRELIGA